MADEGSGVVEYPCPMRPDLVPASMDLLPPRWALLLAPVVMAIAWQSLEGRWLAQSFESRFSRPRSGGDVAHSARRMLRGAMLLAAGMELELRGASKASRIRCPYPGSSVVGLSGHGGWRSMGALGHVSGGLCPRSGALEAGARRDNDWADRGHRGRPSVLCRSS